MESLFEVFGTVSFCGVVTGAVSDTVLAVAAVEVVAADEAAVSEEESSLPQPVAASMMAAVNADRIFFLFIKILLNKFMFNLLIYYIIKQELCQVANIKHTKIFQQDEASAL